MRILTGHPGVQIQFSSVTSAFSRVKDFNSNSQSLGFLGARRTYLHIYRITMNAVRGFTP
jgi:hypothetical protein